MYRLLDLFSGIGGFSLGLERSGGFKTVAFCEIEPFPRKVLRKHWPEVPIYDDVRTLTAERLAADGIGADAICGWFPCQDISLAGEGAGIAEGTRSGLWVEIARLVGEIRPKFLILENVAALLGRGLNRVLGDLAALGYDAEWHCVPASAVGAPHRRDRVWIVAHARGEQHQGRGDALRRALAQEFLSAFTHAARQRWGKDDIHVAGEDRGRTASGQPARSGAPNGWEWLAEPAVGRVANGVPSRVDRLRGLGNAVVPQIPELIGRAILAADLLRLPACGKLASGAIDSVTANQSG